MSFFKRNRKVLLIVLGCLMLLQQVGTRYRLSRSSIDKNGYDKLVHSEIHQLEKLWRQADIADLDSPEKLGNPKELEQARARLKQAEIGILESEKRVQKVTGKRKEFFQKAHAYYHNSTDALLNIVDFLLEKKENYSVIGNEIAFDTETDATKFQELIQQLSYLDQEKADLDTYISNHNSEMAKKLYPK